MKTPLLPPLPVFFFFSLPENEYIKASTKEGTDAKGISDNGKNSSHLHSDKEKDTLRVV